MSTVRPAPKSRPSLAPEPRASHPEPAPGGEYEFSEAHKDRFQALAASLSFVGVSWMLFGALSVLFGMGALYAGYALNGAAILVLAIVFVANAWWTMSAGRALSSMVTTRGKDIQRLMQAVEPLQRLFSFTRVSIIVAALAVVGVAGVIVWCTMLADKGGRCPVGWW